MRRKGKYVNETFLRRKDAEEWALDVERRVDRGDPSPGRSSRDAKTFGDLINLHREDLKEVGKPIGRSKAASLTLLEKRLGRLRLPELDRARLIQFGKERAREGAGPVTLGIDLGYIKTILSQRRETTARKPFFLYLPFSMGHIPNLPSSEFKGKSRIGHYGDKLMEGDYHVGQILDALKQLGVDDNTLLVFASDTVRPEKLFVNTATRERRTWAVRVRSTASLAKLPRARSGPSVSFAGLAM